MQERGQKTYGRWFTPDSPDQEIVSGGGAEADAAAEFLKSLDMPRRGVPFVASHVETKLAVRMRNNGMSR
ncbi:DddA-like double-stranded DNA deaminase toxin [Lentzea sp. NPDC042327]|uniref:DddA-like double-stranded DNA deaminase toxin n=1 Tax=Lentzea sp. NPDC042327 TaxID=3154801 RepID=UPI0033CF4FF1